ncbi:MAG: exodeoxyribonuclease VII large subunit [Ilumatobacteraceae bacterium]
MAPRGARGRSTDGDDPFDDGLFGIEVDDTDEVHEHTYSVAEFGELLNRVLEESFPTQVWVRGEVKGYSDRGQHAYFDIVDDTGAEGTLNVKFFVNARNRLRPVMIKAGLALANGLKVRIAGRPDVFVPRGSLGFKMSDIDPRFTLGELALQRDELLRRLRESGLLDANRQLELSPVPLRVGLVTSDGSAAYHDFCTELERSGLAFTVRLIDARVQGEQALVDVPAAITRLGGATDLDVIAVIRGGGSKVDLAAFDAEPVAMAIARCPLPVFTGIGHEIDRSVADDVAHRAFKTPTACAHGLVEIVREFVDRTEQVWDSIATTAGDVLSSAEVSLQHQVQSVRHQVLQAVERSDRRLVASSVAVHTRVMAGLTRAGVQVDRAADRIRLVPHRVHQREERLDALAERVRLLDPATTMARGWSITRTADGRTVRAATQLSPGDVVVTTFAEGTATSRVEEVNR